MKFSQFKGPFTFHSGPQISRDGPGDMFLNL